MTERHLNQMDALDEELDRALASYTPAEAPAGLERRLVARLTAATDVPRRWPAMFALGRACAACALLAVSLAIVAIHLHRQPRTDAKVQPVPAARPGPADAIPGAQAQAILPVRPALRASALRPVHRAATDTTAETSLSEMRAPSRPAPQAPLTVEERLLLRVVQRRDPEQMAMLNPQVRAIRAAESDKEFQNFVEGSNTGNE